MKGNWNGKKFLALFMAVAMVMASGIFVTTQSFKATDDEDYVAEETEDYTEVADEVAEETTEVLEEETEEEEVIEEEEGLPEEEVVEEATEEEEAAQVAVVFDLNGGEGSQPDTETVDVYDDGGLALGNLPKLSDYTDAANVAHVFVGWSIDENAEGADENFYADGDEVRLYAVWETQEPEEEAVEETAEEETVEETAEDSTEETVEETAEKTEETAEASEETAKEDVEEDAKETAEEKSEESIDEEEKSAKEDADEDSKESAKEEADEESEETAKEDADEEDSKKDAKDNEDTDEEAVEETAEETTEATDEETAEAAAEEAVEEAVVQDTQAAVAGEPFSATSAGGVEVTASYAEGVFPAGTTMKVTDVSNEEALEAVGDAVANANEARAVDITFYDAEGNEIQPNGEVSISFSLKSPLMGDTQTLVHVDDNGNTNVVNSANTSGTGADFSASSFSIYVLIGNGEEVNGNYENRTFDYSIEAYQELTLAENVAKTVNGETVHGRSSLWSRTMRMETERAAPTISFLFLKART